LAKAVEQQPAVEAKLDKWIQKVIGTGPENYTPENWCSLREQMRLTALYTGKCVAFRDHRKLDGEGLPYPARRESLRVSRSMMVIIKYVASLPEDEQRDVFMVYVHRPDETF
jgi:hypothetical protein